MTKAQVLGCVLAGLGTASCAVSDVNSITVTDRLATPLRPACLQAAVISIPDQSPSLERGHWQTNLPASGGTSSDYAFVLPEIEGIPGPHGNALYWVKTYDLAETCDLIWCSERYGLVFTSVAWTEPYPQSESTARKLEGRLISVRQRILDGCGSGLRSAPECRRTHEGGMIVLENACNPDVQPNTAMQSDAATRRR